MGGTCYIAVGEPWVPFPPEKTQVEPHELRTVTDEMMERISFQESRARSAAA
jgi:hypothetical protein